MKRQVLSDIQKLQEQINLKVALLDTLDRDSSASGCFDLRDQLTSFYNLIESMMLLIQRCKGIVPTEDMKKID
jgi:hypothetical protein